MPNKTARPKSKHSTRSVTKKAATKPMRKSIVTRSSRSSLAQPKKASTGNQISNQHLIVMFLICLILFLLTISRVGL